MGGDLCRILGCDSIRAKLATGFTDLTLTQYFSVNLLKLKLSDCSKHFGKPPAPLKCVINVISDTDCEQVVRGMCLRLRRQAYQPLASVYEESVCSPG